MSLLRSFRILKLNKISSYHTRNFILLYVIYWIFHIYKENWHDAWGFKPTHLESVIIPCEPVINGTNNKVEMEKARKWTFHFGIVEEELINSDSSTVCDIVNKYFYFEKNPLSEEEKTYPLAYGLVVYKSIVQVLLELSIFYHPQNIYCITIDRNAVISFQKTLTMIEKCHPNVKVIIGDKSDWATMGILNNVMKCFDYLTRSEHPWKYYQYLAGTDLPIRTNLEMVRIMKALNDSINTDVDIFDRYRYKTMKEVVPPLPIYKSSMSVAVPRAAANALINSKKLYTLLNYLNKTIVPDESFWTTLLGSPKIFNVPGSFAAKKIIWLRHNLQVPPPDEFSVKNVGTSFIMRYQVWLWQKACQGYFKDESCVYGVGDIYEVSRRPEVVAHKFYLEYEPAAFMCLLKEIRRRSHQNSDFDATSYSEMPTVEIKSGKQIHELKHPDWIVQSSFYVHPSRRHLKNDENLNELI